ncbi:MAG TPA: arylsulfotransferase family protein [Urbifossiella sp.]|nr:arylsulfotransferase family protein [Urbifossiella sp.]
MEMKGESVPAAPGPPSQRLLRRCISSFALLSLGYILGAAVIFFDLPGAAFLRRGLQGGAAWYETTRPDAPGDSPASPTVGRIDKPDKTCDGFTLCMYGGGSRATLIDMRGAVVHSWHVPFSQLWAAPPHLKGRINDADVYFNDGHVYPDGDLLAVVEGPINASNPSNGYGLVKLDKDSRVLWKYAEKCHHDVAVGDDGTIYVLTNEIIATVLPGLEYIPTPCMVDFVDVISPDGVRLKRLPILEAIHSSPYAALLAVLDRPRRPSGAAPTVAPFRDDGIRRDVLHTNAVKVLTPALAPKFPWLKAGQLLLSPRQLDAMIVLDPGTGKVVWAARGPWRAQHDPTFLDNGHILLFDNSGAPRGSRVLEFDPKTLAFPWVYPDAAGPHFVSEIRGMSQRLPNGNTLVVNSVGGEALEVTPDRETVWTCSTAPTTLNRARRYTPDRLSFLKGGSRARP